MRLLKVNENLDIEIDGEILEIAEFKYLQKRIRSCKEDKDGRRKLVAKKELAYVYHMGSPDSPYMSYSDKERPKRLAVDLFGDISPDWRPDEVIQQAINKYKELTHYPSVKVLCTLRESLLSTNLIVNKMTQQLEQNMLEEKYKKDIVNKSGVVKTGVQIMLDDIASLLKIAKEIPSSIDIIEKLEEKVIKERGEKASRVKGNQYISDRAR